MVAFGSVDAGSWGVAACHSSSRVHSSSFEGVPSHFLSKLCKLNVWYSVLCKKVSIELCISEALLRGERFISRCSHMFLYGSHRMMQLGSRVGIVAARVVVTARRIACVWSCLYTMLLVRDLCIQVTWYCRLLGGDGGICGVEWLCGCWWLLGVLYSLCNVLWYMMGG